MFGQGYQYVAPARVLDSGVYRVVLGRPRLTVLNGYEVVVFPFSVKGVQEPVKPNQFTLFDCDDWNNKKKAAAFNYRASRIRDCFKLAGGFSEQYFDLWEGAEGVVGVAKDKNGYMDVVQFFAPGSPEAENI